MHKKRQNQHYSNIKKLIENGLRNVVVSGTCLEYKKNCMLSETSKVEPLTKYGKAKNNLRKLEKLNKKYKINLSWLRIFYIYGHSKIIKIYGQIN